MINRKLLFTSKVIFILLFILVKPSLALSFTELNKNHKSSVYDLSDKMDIFIDEKQNLTIDEVVKQDLFSKNKIEKKANYGYVDGAVWLRFELENLNQENDSWILEMAFLAYDDMMLFFPKKNGEYEKIRNDLSIKFDERPIPHRHYMFPITLKKGEKQIYYFRVVSKNIAVFPLKLRSAKDSITKIKNEYYVFGLYYGAFLIIFLYNFCLSFGLKDRRYFDYSLFVLGLGLFQLAMNGFSFEFFWSEDSKKQYLAPLIVMSLFAPITINFVRSFINTKHYCPKLDKGLFATYPLTPLLIISAIFTDPFEIVNFNNPILGSFVTLFLPISLWFLMLKFAKKSNADYAKYSLAIFVISTLIAFFLYFLNKNFIIINNILFLLIVLLSTAAAISAVKQGSRQAYYFLISWSAFVFGVLLLILLGVGLLPYNIFTQNGWQIGAAFSVILLSFGLADNFRNERVAKELARQEAIDNLQKSDRIKDNLLSNVTHELRTPINAMLGLIDRVVSDDEKISQESLQHLKIATSSGRKLNLLINDILTASQLKNGKIKLNLESIDISTVIQIILKTLTPLALVKNIELINNCQNDLPKITADENRIYQIFYNLIGNAIKFTNNGFVAVESEIIGDELLISVKDSGIGIDFDKLHDIFISFEQLQNSLTRSFEGNGLGLSIIKQLVEMHNGRIIVESKPNHGSKFTCFLPINTKVAEEKIIKPSCLAKIFEEAILPNKELPSLNKTVFKAEPFTIFVIDDDPIHNYLVTAHLKGELGYNIVQIQDPKLAMQMIEEQMPDLILLDVMMPDISGFELCEEIRKKYLAQNLPIIFLTAKQESDDIITGFKVGGNDYLTKPFFKEELRVRVKHHLQILLSKRRLASLQNFANQIGNFSDRNQLFSSTLEILYHNCNASSAILFYEYKALNSLSHKKNLHFEISENLHDLLQNRHDYKILQMNNLSENCDIKKIVKSENNLLGSHLILLQIKGFEEYIILIWRQKQYSEFEESDLSYMDNIVWQIRTIVENSQKIILTPGLVKSVYEVEELKDRITYIKSSAQYCDIYVKNKKDPKLIRIGIQTLEHYFGGKKLLRIHRSYLINPALISDLKKVGRDYQLSINHCGELVKIPVGRGYIDKVKAIFDDIKN